MPESSKDVWTKLTEEVEVVLLAQIRTVASARMSLPELAQRIVDVIREQIGDDVPQVTSESPASHGASTESMQSMKQIEDLRRERQWMQDDLQLAAKLVGWVRDAINELEPKLADSGADRELKGGQSREREITDEMVERAALAMIKAGARVVEDVHLRPALEAALAEVEDE